MSQTDDAADAARTFYAELLLPLKRSNMRRHVVYLDLAPGRETYWSAARSRNGGIAELLACDATCLLEMLEAYWAKHPDHNLPKLVPFLLTLQQEIAGSRPVEGADETASLPEFIYPLF